MKYQLLFLLNFISAMVVYAQAKTRVDCSNQNYIDTVAFLQLNNESAYSEIKDIYRHEDYKWEATAVIYGNFEEHLLLIDSLMDLLIKEYEKEKNGSAVDLSLKAINERFDFLIEEYKTFDKTNLTCLWELRISTEIYNSKKFSEDGKIQKAQSLANAICILKQWKLDKLILLNKVLCRTAEIEIEMNPNYFKKDMIVYHTSHGKGKIKYLFDWYALVVFERYAPDGYARKIHTRDKRLEIVN